MSDLPLTKRSTMTLFSDPSCVESHRVRVMLQEKDVPIDIIDVEAGDYPEDLLELNPYGSLPTLVDKDLTLSDSQVIVEYIDERFPHPPLMPVDPVLRARSRMMINRLREEWYVLLAIMDSFETTQKEKDEARKDLRDNLLQMKPMFERSEYFLGDDLTVADISIAVLLWRLEEYNVQLPASAKVIKDYAERIFVRKAFKDSLSEIEEDMRD